MSDASILAADAAFERHRRRMFGLAYKMLGSVAETEDALQEAWLRWRDVDRATVRDEGAFLARIVTRLCLDVLRSSRVKREAYLGAWLPEPIVDEATPAPDAAVDLASDLSVALVLALERLSPLERAAFLLHDVFDVPFAEVAAALDRTETACRQLAARGRVHVAAERPRAHASAEDGAALADAFLKASRGGDMAGLMAILAPDATFVADGGGKRPAAMKPILGAERIANFFGRFVRAGHDIAPRKATPLTINGLPGFVTIELDGLPQTTAFEIEDGRIKVVYVVRNPDKLGRLMEA
ncbi:sigma-70 family RNA polymerase sigma factor [Methylopila sp. M107]|uniref:sigma-70 family RNA polymerase sigma factor n=1 Tax=Methylopila sp. M107 TaxID=1101190 RepID=UPI00036F4482|nr:sigma-70 family RNA polymerase sigma factor [Methylopila sp. M107]